MNQRLSMHFTRKKQYFHSNLASATYFLPGKFFKCFWEGEKKKTILFTVSLPWDCWLSSWAQWKYIMGASTKIPVLFTEQKDLNPRSPSPSLSWLHLMCRTHRLGYFLSLAQKLQILAKFLISNSLAHMFQKTKKCMSLV